MHILLGIISIISGLAFMVWHLSNAANAISEASDNMPGIRSRLRRFFFKRTANVNPLSTIEDPREAVLILMAAIMKDRGDLTEAQLSDLEYWAEHRLHYQNPKDMVTLARWYARDYVESGAVLQRVIKPITRRCDGAQRADIIDLTTRAAQSGDGSISQLQAYTLNELKYKFGDVSQEVALQS